MSFNLYHAADSADDLTATEALLAQLIEDERVQNGLPVIPLSRSLSLVGARHDEDILYNLGGYQAGIAGQNSAHGWSDAPYNALDSSTYGAIWNAPARLGTSYPGYGYEILTGYLAPNTATVTMTPQTAITGWQGSAPHNAVILNQGAWSTIGWGALGIGMQNGVASAWFGHEADPAGSPDVDLQGTYGQYTVTVTTGSIRVQDSVSGRDPTFAIPNAAHLKFSDGTYDVATRTFAASAAPAPTAAALVSWANATAGTSGTNAMDAAAAGGPSYLQNQFIFSGSDDVAFATAAPNVFIHSGGGNDAIQVTSGRNVLDGGLGSNFLTGGTGTDTFFTDARNPGVVWNTLRNFHTGDAATLWGFTPGVSSYHWDSAIGGAAGSQGATLRANIVGGNGRTGTGVDASITFAGLSVAQAQGLQIVTGTSGSSPYLYVYNPGV